MSAHSSILALRGAVAATLLAGSAAFAQQLVLPPENVMTTAQYGDFKVQSLELNEKCYNAGDPRCQPSGPYPVQSSPGQIANYLLILQGGSTADNYPPLTSITGDNAFVPPQGGSDGSDPNTGNFAMGGNNGAEVTPDGFVGDHNGTWEVQLGSLVTYLSAGAGQIANLVFLFDNNQQGAGFDQFQYIFATASVRDANFNVVGNQCYGLFGTGSWGNSNQANCANPNPVAPTYDAAGNVDNGGGDYVPLVTDFCVDKVTGEAYALGLAGNQTYCNNNLSPSGNVGYYISNNLGNNSAEFVAYNRNLEAFVLANAAAHPDWVLSVNIRLANLTDGPEQAWICSRCGLDRQVPEPGTLALVGLSLALLGFMRRRVS